MTDPVEWVQKDLGAQQVWEKYEDAVRELGSASEQKLNFTSLLRSAQAKLDEAEEAVISRVGAELAREAKSSAPSGTGKAPTQAALDRAVKSGIAGDEMCKSIRKDLLLTRLGLDEADARLEYLKIKVRSYSTRLSEIAAELRFYAACKEAETEARRVAVGNPGNRWPR